MEAFLKTAKSYLVHLNQFNGVHVVLGSKPCDLTSATATIVTAFFLNQIKPKTHHVVLPVINVSRKELRLRKEVTFLLEETDIPVNLLICKDEIDLEKLRNEGKLFLTLVDHNIISADQQFLENSVQVFHHHTYQAKDRGDRCDTTIEMVGSCCTLVAEKLLNISSDLDPQIVMLLYRAILLDTACLSEEARRATPKDVQIVAKLETFLEGVTRTEIFEKLKMFDLTGQPPTSQVSSAQNSCPHIPQNNSVDDTFHLQNIRVKQPNFLQSFKKQDMVEEVTKRVIEFGLETSEMKSLTFTAEESIVECSFDSNEPWRVSNVSSGELLTKMQDKDVALANIRKIDGVFQQSNNSINEVEKGNQALSELLTIGDKIEDAPDLGCANISSGEVLFEVFKSPATLEDVYKVQENQRNGFAHGEDMFSLMQMKPLKMDGTIAASENFVKNEPASDRETKLSSLLSEKVSPDNCDLEMVKDSGTEKKGQGKTDTVEECNQEIEHEDLGFDANSYQAETVDFPESPQHLKLLKQRTREAQEFGPDDDELTWSENRKGSVHSTDEQHSRREGLLLVPVTTDGIELYDGSSSDGDGYYEDSFLTGKLSTAEASDNLTDEDIYDTNNLFSENENSDVSERNLDSSLTTVLSTNEINSHFIESSTPFARKGVKGMNGSNRHQTEGFLFEEKASDDNCDNLLLLKLKSCFDQERIKDSYVLSGRIQDILSPAEIEEVLMHSNLYSEYIDDDLFEIFSIAYCNLNLHHENEDESNQAVGGETVYHHKKMLHANKNQISDVISDIKIRAIFEGYKKSEENKQQQKFTLTNVPQRQNVHMATSSSDIRAFFEESLLKSTSTLKKISPELEAESPSDVGTLHGQTVCSDNLFSNSLVLDPNNIEEVVTSVNKEYATKTPLMSSNGVIFKSNSNGMIKEKKILSQNFKKLGEYNAIEVKKNIPSSENFVETTGRCFDNTGHAHVRQSSDDIQMKKLSNVLSSGTTKIVQHAEADQHIQDLNCNNGVGVIGQKTERPSSFSAVRKKKISVHPDILASDNDDDQRSFSSISNKSDADVMSPIDDFTPDDIDTPDDLDDSVLECTASELIPELSAAEEMYDERSWRTCTVGGEERKIDVKVIEPYKKVLSHGGYYGPNKNAIIVFSACYLPDRSRRDYDYVMDNLFLYVLSTLDQLIAEDYILVYLHGATQRSNMPSFGWLKRCYQMIDRRLRKNLKGLYLVHPTFWVKTIVIMTKPFISSKFSRKLQFVNNLKELSDLIPMDDVCIPDKVKQFDEEKALEA
ncbi:uncharacterized protein LOC143224857 isoform X2 [Tachypleus tridentatus]|uniref:uncharacterized protein LOC143224857 isoform X2 n=1 Tax=Tachypleus tridentatus TaxID=6853 RepID=UPI003FD51F8C